MKKTKRVTIIGFPNVGKSTLFNRLAGARKSLVHSLPGMPRDAVTALVCVGDRTFELVDTGGFFGTSDEPFSAKVREKAWQEASRSDLVLLVVDGRRGLLPGEEELFTDLKKSGKKLLVVINKVDTPALEERLGDFYRLGGEDIFPVSGEHNRGLEALRGALAEALPPSPDIKMTRPPLRVAIVGRINVGKSSLVNRLCGEERLIVSEAPGTTRDSTDVLIFRQERAYLLVDTAGLRKLGRTRDDREKAGIIRAKKTIGLADVICLVMDALECPTRQDTAVAHLAYESGKPLVLAVNKWDLVPKDKASTQGFRDKVFQKLEFVGYAPLVFISALTGQRLVKVLDLAEEVWRESGRRIETSRLNTFLAGVVQAHPPLSRDGRRVKIKYMTQQGVRPPTFVLFGHSSARLAPAYERFFLQLLRRQFGFPHTPLRVFMRQG